MNDLINLLKRLAELDPDLCQVTETTVYLPTAHYRFLITDLTHPEIQDRLQGVIQRAIVARGWEFTTDYFPITKSHGAKVTNRETQMTGHAGYDRALIANPATALLGAYILSLSHPEPVHPEPVHPLRQSSGQAEHSLILSLSKGRRVEGSKGRRVCEGAGGGVGE